ncbi:hypothetical protein PENTCL1PPCAC_24332, partial [Pristionchus entomophagus]
LTVLNVYSSHDSPTCNSLSFAFSKLVAPLPISSFTSLYLQFVLFHSQRQNWKGIGSVRQDLSPGAAIGRRRHPVVHVDQTLLPSWAPSTNFNYVRCYSISRIENIHKRSVNVERCEQFIAVFPQNWIDALSQMFRNGNEHHRIIDLPIAKPRIS